MITICPDYYREFHCIADKCRHSCCIGWEIDIDPATREKYRRVPGEFGALLNASIDDGDKVSSFRLKESERCPLLNANGLCDLITELGEENLCQICADHPRFRNYYADRTEIGLGLCCEEAARIILTREEPMQLVTLEDTGTEEPLPAEEAELLTLRAELLATMQDRTHPLEERLNALLEAVDFTIPQRDWATVYRNLERLDPAWDSCIETISHLESSLAAFDTAFEQFCVYLLYRHLPGALQDDDLPGRVAFCVLSTQVLMALCAAKEHCGIADLLDLARMYSAEIEYSEDNISALLDALYEVGSAG